MLLLLVVVQCTLTALAFSAALCRQHRCFLAWLHAVFFLNPNQGWAVGSRGTVLSTNDGGKSWQAKAQPTEDTIRDIYFSDDLNGLLVCERNIYDLRSNDESRAYLMKTSDG